jgi:hypothetical protein
MSETADDEDLEHPRFIRMRAEDTFDGQERVFTRATYDPPGPGYRSLRALRPPRVRPGGDVLWVSGALPGSVHDKKAEWVWGVLTGLEAAGLIVLADKGYQGSTYAKIPYRGRNKPESQKAANRAHAKLRAPGERANAQLKTWRILRKLRCCPWRAGQLAKAIHASQVREA